MTAPGAALHTLPPALLHDLRTPLGQIIGYAELLAERAVEAGDERFVPDLEKVSAAGYRMLALFDEHFTAARTPEPGFTRDDADLLAGLAAGRPPGPAERERLASLSARVAALLVPRPGDGT